MRIDLPSEALEFGLETRLFDTCAAQAITLPVAKQEDRFVDVSDRNDDGDDREERGGERVRARSMISGALSPYPEKPRGHRDRVETNDGQQQAEPAPRVQQPILATLQPEVESTIAFPDDEGDQ